MTTGFLGVGNDEADAGHEMGQYLAMCIPAYYARHMGFKEDHRVQAALTVDAGISIRARKWDRRAFAEELKLMREAMPMTKSVFEKLRRQANSICWRR
ncbi:AbrB/MazE/SpoVT family DNA-binding domain-containing protein [Burkholderia sp. PU8-34]